MALPFFADFGGWLSGEDPFSVQPAGLPTQLADSGVRYDFNDGARVWCPPGYWMVEIYDDESGHLLYRQELKDGWVFSSLKNWWAFRIVVRDLEQDCLVLEHIQNLSKREVLLSFGPKIGDFISYLPFVEKFRLRHGCLIDCTCCHSGLITIVEDQYPGIHFFTSGQITTNKYYATYRFSSHLSRSSSVHPFELRQNCLGQAIGYMLGVEPVLERPRVRPSSRMLKEPYVCIAAKTTLQAKHWNNPQGWPEVVDYLKSLNFRVLCVDREAEVDTGRSIHRIPSGAEDFTGRPLTEIFDILSQSTFFIGLSSGLSWLAWSAGLPVVLISGFSLPMTEFDTPYRVGNTNGCAGCWNDHSLAFDFDDFWLCPRHKDTSRQFECTRNITGRQVINHIRRLIHDHDISLPVQEHKTGQVELEVVKVYRRSDLGRYDSYISDICLKCGFKRRPVSSHMYGSGWMYMHASKQWEYPFVLENLPVIERPLKIADVGGGRGALSVYLAALGHDVSTFDISFEPGYMSSEDREFMIMARAAGVGVFYGSIWDLPIASESFDVVTCISVLEHLRGKGQAFREMVRILKEGGRLIVTFDLVESGALNSRLEAEREEIFSLELLKDTLAGLGLSAISLPDEDEVRVSLSDISEDMVAISSGLTVGGLVLVKGSGLIQERTRTSLESNNAYDRKY